MESCTAESVPTWFKEGVYAEYRFDSGSISFLNGTFLSFSKETRAKVTFHWECISMTDSTSRLNVTISILHETRDFWLSTLLDVNFETRSVNMLNGTYVGRTFLWLSSNLEENQTISITDGVIGNISVVGLGNSPQGLQKAFWVMGTGQVDGHLIAPSGGYDWDTGVLLESGFWGEPTLLALGIVDLGVAGNTEFTATNIDLGPGKPMTEELQVELPEMLLIVAVIGTFAFMFLAAFWSRRRGRNAVRTKKIKFRGFVCVNSDLLIDGAMAFQLV